MGIRGIRAERSSRAGETLRFRASKKSMKGLMPRLLPRLASSPPSAEPKPPACILYDTSHHRCECRPSAKLCGGRANEPFFQAQEGGAKASACHGFKMFTPILSPQCSVPAPAPSQHPHSLLRPPPLSQSKQRSDHLNPTT